MPQLKVTRHAIERFRKRTKSKKPKADIREVLRRVAREGVEVEPTSEPIVEGVKYFVVANLVVVVTNNTIVTTYKAGIGQFREVKGDESK